MKKRIMTAGMLAMILAMGMTACANADTKEKSTTKKEQVSESDEKKEQKMSDNEANVMNEKQKKIYEKIKKTYNDCVLVPKGLYSISILLSVYS